MYVKKISLSVASLLLSGVIAFGQQSANNQKLSDTESFVLVLYTSAHALTKSCPDYMINKTRLKEVLAAHDMTEKDFLKGGKYNHQLKSFNKKIDAMFNGWQNLETQTGAKLTACDIARDLLGPKAKGYNTNILVLKEKSG